MIRTAFKEAIVDTGIALIINVPISYALLYVADYFDMDIGTTAIFLTSVFTVIAILRKTTVGTIFKLKGETR